MLDSEKTSTQSAASSVAASGLGIALAALTVLVVLAVAALLIVKRWRSARAACDSRKPLDSRSRFSMRDRLNTTEYMYNLAMLDRRVAMDEILENRRRAIFSPEIDGSDVIDVYTVSDNMTSLIDEDDDQSEIAKIDTVSYRS